MTRLLVGLPLIAGLIVAANAGYFPECHRDEWQCDDGTCIPSSKRCDNIRDCPYDASDEQKCDSALITCPPTKFQCDKNECLSMTKRCNGLFDCADMSDEDGCEGICLPGNFKCNDGACIPEEQRCDNHKDCSDDEINCVGCPRNKFQCRDRTCIPARMRCNGHAECRDKSDELNCGRAKKNGSEIQNSLKQLQDPMETTNSTQTDNNSCNHFHASDLTLILSLSTVYSFFRSIKMTNI